MNIENSSGSGCRAMVLSGLMLLAPTTLWAAVSASLDRTTVYEGDTVNLTISVEGGGAAGQPDLSPLQQDFEILATRHGTQVQIINGRRSDRVTWSVELEPRHSGNIPVPAITVGQDTTRPMVLAVSEQPAGATATLGDPLFITVTADPGDAGTYVQEQLRYKVRLFSRERIVNGELSAPRPANAVVEQLGRDRSYSARIGGQSYQVIERDYAIFPEKSGELRIPPLTFKGQVASAAGSRRTAGPFGRMDSMMSDMLGDPFFERFFERRSLMSGMFGGGGEPVRIQGEPVSVDVRPRPDGYVGQHWLPAQSVTLSDSWADGAPIFRAGEPLSRTITLEATGAVSSQLPQIDMAESEGLRVYRDQQDQQNTTDGEWVHGRLTQSFSVMPTRGGVVSVPEVRVAWWDTASDQERVAELPGFEVDVLPGVGAGQSAAVAERPTPVVAMREDENATALGLDAMLSWQQNAVPWLLAALIAAVLTAALGWWRSSRTGTPAGSPPTGRRRAGDRARGELQQACRQNDAAKASRSLLAWAAQTWPGDPPTNLVALSAKLARGADEVQALNRALYGAGAEDWQGDPLWREVRSGLVARSQQSSMLREGLPPLYPQHG